MSWFFKSETKLEAKSDDEESEETDYSMGDNTEDDSDELSESVSCPGFQLHPNEYRHVETLSFPDLSNMLDYFSQMENKDENEDDDDDEESHNDRPVQVIRFECCTGQFPKVQQLHSSSNNYNSYCACPQWPLYSGCPRPYCYSTNACPPPTCIPAAPDNLIGRNMPYSPSFYSQPPERNYVKATPDGRGGWIIDNSSGSNGTARKGKNTKKGKKGARHTTWEDEEEYEIDSKSKKKVSGGKKKRWA